jgi:Uma2 family endonuclease
MATTIFQSEKPQKRIDYPTSDGKPMAETDWHRIVMTAVIQMLDRWFAGDREIYVAGNMLMYYVPGNKRKHVSPDVFVVFGVPKKLRGCFLVWEEGKAPAVVIEITSKTTKKEDMNKKMVLYREVLKVTEYFLFDPLGDYLKPRLEGYRLHHGTFVSIEQVEGRLPSNMLDLHLQAEGTDLRLYDPRTGTWLPTPDERADQAGQRADREHERGDREHERAERERERADREHERAEREGQRANDLEKELERLRQASKKPRDPKK